MEYNSIFAKSFSRYERKKLGYSAFIGFLIVLLSFFIVFGPPLHSLQPILNLQLNVPSGLHMIMIEETNVTQLLEQQKLLPQTLENFKSNSVFEPHEQKSPQILRQGNFLKLHSQRLQQLEHWQQQERKGFITRSISYGLESVKKHELIKPVCNLKEPRSNFCEMNGDIRIHGNASTVFFSSPQVDVLEQNKSWKIKPYARKGDRAAMRSVSEFSVRSFAAQSDAPSCVVNHSVPAIVFSVAGYSSNIFHTFSELLIPLFITSRHFHGEVQFLATDDSRSSWASKYKPVLDKLSRYEIINVDREDKIHCFPSMTVGLKLHEEFRIDPLIARNEYSIKDFRKLLWSAYSLKRAEAIRIRYHQRKKPRLLILTRRRTRSFTNEEEIFELATSLGFEVILAEPALMDLAKFADIVNSCDVMMGVHGAGLTNLAFLPSNAVLIQVVPLGGLQWVSRHYYAEPAMDMGISYLEYNIEENESTLIEQYPRDDAVFKDPLSIHKQGWAAVKAIYFFKQNVMLNVSRFRATLLEALQLLHHAHQLE